MYYQHGLYYPTPIICKMRNHIDLPLRSHLYLIFIFFFQLNNILKMSKYKVYFYVYIFYNISIFLACLGYLRKKVVDNICILIWNRGRVHNSLCFYSMKTLYKEIQFSNISMSIYICLHFILFHIFFFSWRIYIFSSLVLITFVFRLIKLWYKYRVVIFIEKRKKGGV